jgi:hypothetical protein
MARLRTNHKHFTLILLIASVLSNFTQFINAKAGSNPLPAETMLVAPANDNIANAQLISGINNNVPVTTTAATKEAGEPAHALNVGGASVWYKYVAPGNGVLSFYTTNVNFNTMLAVYAGSTINSLKLIASNDDYETPVSFTYTSKIIFGTQSGATYYLAVDGKNSNGVAESGTCNLNYQFINSPTNDNFSGAASGNAWLLTAGRTVTFNASNVGTSKEPGEPDHAGNAGGRSVWFKWSNNGIYPRTYEFTVNSQALGNPNSGVDTLFAIYTGSAVDNLTPVASKRFIGHGSLLLNAAANTTYYLALDGFDGGQGAGTANFAMTYGVARTVKVPDYDHDGKADVAVFRPTTGYWYSSDSVTGALRQTQFGANGDKPMFGDYDRDGQPDYSIFRPDTSTWYLLNASYGFSGFNWGLNTDIPLLQSAYFEGNKYTYATVFRPSTGTWHQYVGVNGNSIQFGQNGDIPLFADFTGDGTDEYTVFRPSNGTWYILDQVANQMRIVQFGLSGDRPIAADFDGDGRSDIAVFRPSNGTWYYLNSTDGSFNFIQFGQNGDKPQAADFDNLGRAEVAVFRNGIWYIRNSYSGDSRTVPFGLVTDVPISSPTQ